MRGAVSVALVYLYYDPDGTTADKQKSSLISATLTVVLFSTLVYGAITKPMLDLLLGAAGAQHCPRLVLPGWQLHSCASRPSSCNCNCPCLASCSLLEACGTHPFGLLLSVHPLAWRCLSPLPASSTQQSLQGAAAQEIADRRSVP